MMNKQILLVQRPKGIVREEHFELKEIALSSLLDGELIIKNKFISLDPAMRGWMNEGTTYIKGVELNTVMRAFAVGEVVESKNIDFKVGQKVQGLFGVQEYFLTDGKNVQKIESSNFPLSWYLGILGMPGLTAYFGLLDKGKPQLGETVLVSGAAGMVGSLVGQIAKIKGCNVIGIAGGADKCNYVKHELGFDACIDYKNEDVAKSIKQLSPNGINIYFDNVGGQTLDDALLNLAIGARVVVCGAISQYNDAQFNGLKNYMKIVSARGTLSGIIVLDYFYRAQEAINDISNWIQEGKVKYREHKIEGLENFATTLQMLFTGANNGKLLLQL
ncbi:MAG: NADP-dependent oxidoreductase [Chitinophagaceae bacterium]